jgi:hypothetical protein
MEIFKYIIPAVVIKKIYDSPRPKKRYMTDEELDAAEDAAMDRD